MRTRESPGRSDLVNAVKRMSPMNKTRENPKQGLLLQPIGQGEAAWRGYQKVHTASLEMPGLRNLSTRLGDAAPLNGTAILGCVIVTPETAFFMFALRRLGAELSWCSDNRFASDPDVIAYLKASDFEVFAEPNMSEELYYDCMKQAYSRFEDHPSVQIHDDGCDITRYLAENDPAFLRERVWGVTEQTTCGITFLTHLYRKRMLPCPSISVAGAYLKKFDNFFGVQQAITHALTNAGVSIASKKATVIGFGHVGSGAARQLRSLGASVGIVECEITKLARAYFEAFVPRSIEEALADSELILSATGCHMTITGEMIDAHARDGLILGNIGHGLEEIDVEWLQRHGMREEVNPYRAAFTLSDGRVIHSLCEGALVNFVAGQGNPPGELSLTFTATALAQIEFAESRRQGKSRKKPSIYRLSAQAEELCGELNFPQLLPKLYRLSDEQRRYLALDDGPSVHGEDRRPAPIAAFSQPDAKSAD